MGCSSAKRAIPGGMLITSEATKNKPPNHSSAPQSRSSTGRLCCRAMRRNHHSKAMGASMPTHSYHSQPNRKKYDRVCTTSRYAPVTGGNKPNGNSNSKDKGKDEAGDAPFARTRNFLGPLASHHSSEA